MNSRDLPPNSGPIPEVRVFLSYEEIRKLPGFKENHPVNKLTYNNLAGHYEFDEQTMECCFRKENGNLCRTKHGFGFVVKDKDGFVTIVGNCCAKHKFGADAKIKGDRARYLNEKRRLERLESVKNLLENKEHHLKVLSGLKNNLSEVLRKVDLFKADLGTQTARKLIEMSKTNNISVMVDAVNFKDYKDEEGQTKQERRVVPHVLGSLRGLPILNKKNFEDIFYDIHIVEKTYAAAGAITEDIKSRELDDLSSKLNRFDSIVRNTESLKRYEVEFFKNDFLLLCFLVSDKSERYGSARISLTLSNVSGGKDKAKQWLIDEEQKIKLRLKADRLQIRD